jgi:hypothetical protein
MPGKLMSERIKISVAQGSFQSASEHPPLKTAKPMAKRWTEVAPELLAENLLYIGLVVDNKN